MPRGWVIAKNEPVRKLETNLWIFQGETPGLPMPLVRTMTVVRRDDGALVVHSAICLDEPAMKALEAWGTPAFLVLPNAWHKIDARAWKDRYPSMRVFCPRAGMKDVAPVVNVDAETESFPADETVRFDVLDGNGKETVMTVRSSGRATLVFGDTFMNTPHLPGVAGFMYRLAGASGGPRVHPFMKWMSKKKPLAGHLSRLVDTPNLTRLVPGHGEPLEARAPETLRDAVAAM